MFLAAGAKKVRLPDYDTERARLDKALVAAPAVVDTERDELLRALGVR